MEDTTSMPKKKGLWNWWQCDGVMDLLGLPAKAKDPKYDPKSIREDFGKHGEIWSDYGDRLSYITEFAELEDGSILLCATVSSWGGTFQSHDDISIRWYRGERT